MVQYIITPWLNRGELLTIRQRFYPSAKDAVSDADIRSAVEKVSMWMQRGNCPHLVESTAILTSARLNDNPRNSNYCIRAAYSLAFSRFVTGLLDSHQDKRRKLSMYSIAKTIGLPATFVELRHQATHEALPSLPKLRTASVRALQWIWDYYWYPLSAESSAAKDCKTFLEKSLREANDSSDEELRGILRQWDSGLIKAILLEINETIDDPNALLRSLRLSRIVDGDLELDENDLTDEGEIRNIEQVRAELAKMQDILPGSETDKTREEEPFSDTGERSEHTSDEKGWTRWNRAWVPKPIGIV